MDKYRFILDRSVVSKHGGSNLTVALYIAFTNESPEGVVPHRIFSVNLRQGGREQKRYVSSYNDPLLTNYYSSVGPGESVKFMLEWELDSEDEEAEVIFTDSVGLGVKETVFSAFFTPGGSSSSSSAAEPRKPLAIIGSEVYETKAVDDHTWHTAVRVTFRFINMTGRTMMPSLLDIEAYQSGALLHNFDPDETETDDNLYADVANGGSVDFSRSWIITKDRPVIITAKDDDDDTILEKELEMTGFPENPKKTERWTCAWPAAVMTEEDGASLIFLGLDRAGQNVLPRFRAINGRNFPLRIYGDCFIEVFQNGKSLERTFDLLNIRYCILANVPVGARDEKEFIDPFILEDNSPVDIVFGPSRDSVRRIHMSMGPSEAVTVPLSQRCGPDAGRMEMRSGDFGIRLDTASIGRGDDGERAFLAAFIFSYSGSSMAKVDSEISLHVTCVQNGEKMDLLYMDTGDDYDRWVLPGASGTAVYPFGINGDDPVSILADTGDGVPMLYNFIIEDGRAKLMSRRPYADDEPEEDYGKKEEDLDDLFIYFTAWLYARDNDGDTMGLPVFDYDAQAEAHLTEFESIIMAAGGNPFDYEDFCRAARGDLSFRRDGDMDFRTAGREEDLSYLLDDDDDFAFGSDDSEADILDPDLDILDIDGDGFIDRDDMDFDLDDDDPFDFDGDGFDDFDTFR